mgnify:CR=1 FL=1
MEAFIEWGWPGVQLLIEFLEGFRNLEGTFQCNIISTLVEIAEKNMKGKEKDNILKFLKSKDPAMVMMGASLLKGILEK